MSIRDDFFASKAVGALWDVAVSIKRGNPLPLDSNSVFESYEALETYVAGPLAYPGQVVAVVGESSTNIYYLNQNLGIQAVGGVPSVDDKTIELNNDTLSLYNFEKFFYKFVEETVDETSGETVAAHYEKVAVSETNPWKAGLEPKVVLEGEEYVIGWFEPKDTIVEELQDTVAELKTSTENLDDSINGENGLVKQIDAIKKDIGVKADAEKEIVASGIYAELDKKADANNVYTKTETDTLIANAAHLKRKVFETKELAQAFVNENIATAEQYIYMVPSGLQLDSNRYYEYMVVEGVLEQVGNWEVNLDDYFTEGELKDYLNNYYTQNEVNAILANYAKSSDLEGYYTSEQVDQLLAKEYTKEEVDNLLKDYVKAEIGKNLVLDTEIIKLATIKENAEPNYIKTVTSDFKVSEAGELSLVSIKSSQISDLQDELNKKVNVKSSNFNGVDTEWILLSPENQAKLNALVIGEEGVEISGKVNAENVEGLNSWILTNRDTVQGLYPTADADKLKNIEAGAQVNFIKEVDTVQFSVNENGVLSLNSINVNKINNLESVLPGFTAVSNDFVINEIDNVKTLALKDSYVTTTVYAAEVGDLSKLIHVASEKSTIVDEINSINERLEWQDLI